MATLREVYGEQAARSELGSAAEHWSGPPEMVDRIASTTGVTAGQVVVDLGCGLGGPARRLAALTGCRVIGIDLLEPVLREAKSRLDPKMAGRVIFAAGSSVRVPIRDEAADQIWALGSVAHVADLRAFSRECARVLRPGGRIVLTEALWEGLGEPRFAASGLAPLPWRALRPAEVATALEGAGFRQVVIHPWPGGDPPPRLPSDPALAADLAGGTLVSRMIMANRS